MSRKDCCTPDEIGTFVSVKVDVTKIVKYLCIAGVLIVGIIFGTRCCHKMMEEGCCELIK